MRSRLAVPAATVLLTGTTVLLTPPQVHAASCRQALRITVSPTPLARGDAATGTVKLRCAIGSHGAHVKLKTSWAGFSLPASISVQAHSSSARFTLHVTQGVSASTEYRIGASLGRLQAFASVPVVRQTGVRSFSISPTTVAAGQKATGAIQLSGQARNTDFTVRLASDDPHVVVPSSVTVPAHVNTAKFTITTTDPHVPITTAVHVGGRSASLSVTPKDPAVMNVYVVNGPQEVRPNVPNVGHVDLAGPAPASGTVVSLSAGVPSLVVPATVKVPAGAASVTFPITAEQQPNRIYGAMITASANGRGATTTIDVLPAGNLDSVGDAVFVGNGSTGRKRVSLSHAQGTDTVIALSSDNPDVIVPARVTVPAGQTKAEFLVTVGTLPSEQTVTITAALGDETVSRQFPAGRNGPRTLLLGPVSGPYVKAGDAIQCRVVLYAVAPEGGALVTLTSDDPHVVLPPTVLIPAGGGGVDFRGTSKGPLAADTTVTVTASWNGESVSRSLVVHAAP